MQPSQSLDLRVLGGSAQTYDAVVEVSISLFFLACFYVNAAREIKRKIDVDFRALSFDDARHLTSLHCDRFSIAWVGAWYAHEPHLSIEEFLEVASRYLVVASLAYASCAGARIGNTRRTFDPQGFRLWTATLLGDCWRQQHDEIKL